VPKAVITPPTETPRPDRVILVVEDEAMIRWPIAESLRDEGFTVVEAGDADEALHYIKTNIVDFVFTDVRMPGSMNGLTFARIVRRDYPGVPLLVTSGHLVRWDVEPDIKLVVKPYKQAEILGIIVAAIGSGRADGDGEVK